MNWLWMLIGTYLLYATVMVLAHPQFIYPFGPDAFDDPSFVPRADLNFQHFAAKNNFAPLSTQCCFGS